MLGVIGLGLGVVLLCGVAGALFGMSRRPAPLDAATLLAERFERAGPFPFGLEPVGAERGPGGRETVRFEGPERLPADAETAAAVTAAAVPEDAGAEDAVPGDAVPGDAVPGDGSTNGVAEVPTPPRIEWKKLPEVPGERPLRAALAWYPLRSAERILRDQFTSLRFEGGGPMGAGGGPGGGHGGGMGGGGPHGDGPPKPPKPKLQDAGNVQWAGYSAPYVRLREFELLGDGDEVAGQFVETVRVNLTLPDRCCVLYVRWAPGEVGSREQALEVLHALVPRTSP